jgi:hypothetical protein
VDVGWSNAQFFGWMLVIHQPDMRCKIEVIFVTNHDFSIHLWWQSGHLGSYKKMKDLSKVLTKEPEVPANTIQVGYVAARL